MRKSGVGLLGKSGVGLLDLLGYADLPLSRRGIFLLFFRPLSCRGIISADIRVRVLLPLLKDVWLPGIKI